MKEEGEDIIKSRVEIERDIGKRINRVVGELKIKILSLNERNIMIDEDWIGLSKNEEEIIKSKRGKLKEDGKEEMKLRKKIGWIGEMEREWGDEKNVISIKRKVFGRESCELEKR